MTVCQDEVSANISDSCYYQHFNMSDGETDKYGGTCTYKLFEKAAGTVCTAMDDGPTLVHCHHGQSRSAAVCVAALGVHDGCTFNEAYSRVREARPIINPNTQLRGFARDYIQRNS